MLGPGEWFGQTVSWHVRCVEPVDLQALCLNFLPNPELVLTPHCIRHQIIPLRWAFDYKSDEKGFVARFKARLCARPILEE
ncbi:reverse transcriptase (RNA-dependent DNA polymerase) domain-containing protein [Penicillium bovifimosum]|uniref:Reverse transcriptase (RNA-dependent DNA polymerase) domain-containing protein n=1 Tax=Penicillium bovifimosum TaxID=126998 RepID=A0A9W9GT25_9EURO|nr:reverse transcriptase (RNA-dependent DNA polymerase) domain-containing protein [Penicillium bovifimosum]KAJ5129421.1 reverse transcriptase (RNA-dependent DNA polymerase) domain-containing protein [Penicillium bovifimosum]